MFWVFFAAASLLLSWDRFYSTTKCNCYSSVSCNYICLSYLQTLKKEKKNKNKSLMCQALYPDCAVCSGVCSLFFAMTHAGEITRKLNSSLSTGFKRENNNNKKISICSSSTSHDCVVFLQLSVSSINYFLVIHPSVCVCPGDARGLGGGTRQGSSPGLTINSSP